MIKNVSKVALVAAALIALPGAAQAGSATASGTATLTVINQCTVTGATVNLGTYTSNQTWANVGAALGSHNGTTYTAGSQGQEYLNFGSVTCDSGAPYTLTIKGTSTGVSGAIKITQGGKVVNFLPAIKKVGGTTVADSNASYAGTGAHVYTSAVAGTGTGAAQTLLGNVTLALGTSGSTALATDTLGTAGTASDTLSYTLNF